jgi:hypothetical protein
VSSCDVDGSGENPYSGFNPLTIRGNRHVDYTGTYVTNLPKETELITETSEGLAVILSKLDAAPTGTYTIVKHLNHPDQHTGSRQTVERVMTIRETGRGKVINPEAFKVAPANTMANAKTERLLSDLGYEVAEDGRITGVPIPETIRMNAMALGVDIELLDIGKIDGNTYVQTIARRKYPLAVGDEGYFIHDSTDDHLTAVVLGGEVLKDMLCAAATRALDRDSCTEAAEQIDKFTSNLGGMLYVHKGLISRGYEGLLDAGLKLGFSQGEIDELVVFARDRANAYGIELKPSAVDFKPSQSQE